MKLPLIGVVIVLLVVSHTSTPAQEEANSTESSSRLRPNEQELRTPKRPLHPETADPMDANVLNDRWGLLASLADSTYQTKDFGQGVYTERYRWIKPGLVMERVSAGSGAPIIRVWEVDFSRGGVIIESLQGQKMAEGIVQESGAAYFYNPSVFTRSFTGVLLFPRGDSLRLHGSIYRRAEDTPGSRERASDLDRKVAKESVAPSRTWGILGSLVGNEYYAKTNQHGVLVVRFSWLEEAKRMGVSYRAIDGKSMTAFDSVLSLSPTGLVEMVGQSTDGDSFYARPGPDGSMLFELKGFFSTRGVRALYPSGRGYKLVHANGDQIDSAAIQRAALWSPFEGADRTALIEHHRAWYQRYQAELERREEARREREVARDMQAAESGGASELFGALMLGVLRGAAEAYAPRAAQQAPAQALMNSMQARERARRAEQQAQQQAEQGRVGGQREAAARAQSESAHEGVVRLGTPNVSSGAVRPERASDGKPLATSAAGRSITDSASSISSGSRLPAIVIREPDAPRPLPIDAAAEKQRREGIEWKRQQTAKHAAEAARASAERQRLIADRDATLARLLAACAANGVPKERCPMQARRE